MKGKLVSALEALEQNLKLAGYTIDQIVPKTDLSYASVFLNNGVSVDIIPRSGWAVTKELSDGKMRCYPTRKNFSEVIADIEKP